METNRRNFLQLLGLGAAGLVLDPEKLLWIPGQKTIFLPAIKPVSLYGIPYHQSNLSTGTWLGFSRSNIIKEELKELIVKLEYNKIT